MKKIFLVITALALLLVSCDRDDSHIVAPATPGQTQGGAVVGFNTDGVTNPKFEDTHLYGFDAAQKMIVHKYYPTPKELSADMFTLDAGAYTFVAVLNVGQAFNPVTRADAPLSDITLSRLLNYVKQSESEYPDMLTGMIARTITENEVVRIEIPLADRSGGITTTLVTLNVTLPDASFGDYQQNRVRATQPYHLRGVAEFRRKGETEPVSRIAAVLTPTADAGNYTLTAELPQDGYDVALWVDYTANRSAADLWYTTGSLQAVKLIADDRTYTAGSDTREVFSGTSASVAVATERPQAKYTLISDDVERYRQLMAANPGKYVPLDELSTQIIYEGYLPDGFNAVTGKPNSSAEGYRCTPAALPAVGEADTEVGIGSDYVFVNGSESAVAVTVLVTDKAGRTVSRVPGVMVQYKRNMLTTVRGDFLTAGVVTPGININTDWEGVHEVEF